MTFKDLVVFVKAVEASPELIPEVEKLIADAKALWTTLQPIIDAAKTPESAPVVPATPPAPPTA